ncbi:MAG: ABC transporter permease [Nitrospirae bacterium]|nr:ABC transporter permease [Nitrospirota bacterium]
MIGRFAYAAAEALRGIRAGGASSVLAFLATAIALSILGLFILTAHNFSRLLDRWSQGFQVTVYLADGTGSKEAAALLAAVRRQPEVAEAVHTTPEEALKTFKKELGDQKSLLEGLGENPLPASIDIKLKPEARTLIEVEALARRLKGLPGAAEIQYGQEWISNLSLIMGVLRIVSLAGGGLIAAGVVFLVANTIKLTIYARRDEVEVLSILGATPSFIRTPFVLEGMIQGGLGAAAALAVLAALVGWVNFELARTSHLLVGSVRIDRLPLSAAAGLELFGIALGWIGSRISTGRLLEK